MLIPIGHEESEVRRLPWISIVIGVSCILIYWFSGQAEDRAQERAEESLTAAVQYYGERPYLEADEEVASAAEWWYVEEEADSWYEESEEEGGFYTDDFYSGYGYKGEESGRDEVGPLQRETEQQELDRLTDEWQEARGGIPMYRFGLIPNQLEFGDLIASMFMHAGLMHLIGNLLFFWLSGPPLEDVWGRPVFAAFYLAAGIVGGLLWVARYPQSDIPLVGASGAVAGLMGAFMVRFWSSKIRMFYFYWIGFRIFTGTFSSPAWVMLGLWFATELFWASAMDSVAGEFGGVANLVHVGGFAFGAGTAAVIRHLKTEEKVFRPKIDAKLGEEENVVIEQAHDLRNQGRLEEAWELLAAESRQHPSNWDANLALWDVGLLLERPQDAKAALLRCIRQELRRGEPDMATDHWLELTEHVPEVEVDLNLRIHLAEAFLEMQRDHDAAELLATVHENLDPELPLGIRVRLARTAARSRSASAPALCEAVLRDPTLPEEIRQEITELFARTKAQGLRTPLSDEPEAAAVEDYSPLPLSEEAPAQRALKLMPAIPKHLTGEKISVEVGGQARLLPLKNVQAVAAARIDAGIQNAFVVIDLLVDSLFSDRTQIRSVRLRSDEFDARTLIASQSDPHQALVAFIDNLLAISGATPVPDADSVKGQPFYSFASLSDYETKVFGFTTDVTA